MPDPTPAESPAEPRLVELSTLAEQTEAVDTLIALAHQHIRVFDQDLSQTGWNSAARADRLASFLRQVRGRRLDIIVHDTRYLESACPHMLALLRNYSHALAIYQTGPEGKVATDPLLIVDGRHYLHRFHFEQPRAALGIDQPEHTQPLASRFEEIWATGQEGLSGTVLGL
jgi:DNA-binding LacI/PurR family transcriptional regulator